MGIEKYRDQNILAWLYYNPNYEIASDGFSGAVNRRCYVYPRVLIRDNTYNLIDPNDFPKVGRIEVRIQGNNSSEEICSKFGSLVSIRINKDLDGGNDEANNKYSLRYNPRFGAQSSEIWIDRFSSKNFYQVIDISSDIDLVLDRHSIPEPDVEIFATHILLRYETKLYGPFACDTKEGSTSLDGLKEYDYYIGEYEASVYNDEVLPIENQDSKEALILIPKNSIPSPQYCEGCFDWISSKTLIDDFLAILKQKEIYSLGSIRQFKSMAYQLHESCKDGVLTDERLLRLDGIFTEILKRVDYPATATESLLKDLEIRKFLAQEAVKNFPEQIKSDILGLPEIQECITQLTEKKQALEQSIQKLEKKHASHHSIRSSEYEACQQEVKDLKSKLKVYEEKAEFCREIDALRQEKNELREERDKAKAIYDQQLKDNEDLQKQCENTLRSFNDRAVQTARILDNKLLDKILRGIDDDSVEESLVTFDVSLLCDQSMDFEEIIKKVHLFIRDEAHRDVSFNDVANYLICITQGFITTFAGEPGSGKTSLCNILAKALGLMTETSQRRFVDVSVERGWTSHTDLIGYYNPLSKKIEYSNREVFDAFARINEEGSVDQTTVAPLIILLDEANLSPLEHYWAAFLKNCDFSSVQNRSISLGGTKIFKLPEHLRFLATVNFDHTTEDLSPRFLDRSWVIMLDPGRIDDEIDDEIANCPEMFSYADLKKAFSATEDDLIDEAIQNKWESIQKIFRDRGLQIMPRSLKMVRNYCAVGCRCMERDTPTTKFAPLDYAVSQKILPTINGNGDHYHDLIEDLLKECTAQNMPMTAKHLERMKQAAESNMGFIQFFSH